MELILKLRNGKQETVLVSLVEDTEYLSYINLGTMEISNTKFTTLEDVVDDLILERDPATIAFKGEHNSRYTIYSDLIWFLIKIML